MCGELHPDVVAFVAQAVKADPATLEAYDWGVTARLSGTRRRSARISGSGCAGRKTPRGSPGELAGDTAQRTRRFELVREAFLVTCRERQL